MFRRCSLYVAALNRITDAIQCSNRALLGADQAQTCSILRNLAKLYDSQQNYAEAANSHRQQIQIAEMLGRSVGDFAASYLYVAQYEMDMLDRKRDAIDCVPGRAFEQQPHPTNGRGKSMELAGSGRGQGQGGEDQEDITVRDVASALAMYRRVIESNAPEKEMAEEDVRYIRRRQEAVDWEPAL